MTTVPIAAAHPDPGSEGPGSIRFARPEPVAVRIGWPDEARHFTPWLAQHLDWMEIPELGPLSAIEIEIALPGTMRALDILAETSDGQKVAIENQYSRVDHDHLTRGLAYAVGLQARALVVVAEAHGLEFTGVLARAFHDSAAPTLPSPVAVGV